MTAAISAFFRRRLVTDALSLYAVQALNYLLPLVVLPFLLRALGPESYGSVLLAQSLLGYALILTTFGFNFTAARDISVARRDPQAIARVYWTTMAAKGSLLVVSLMAVAVVVAAIPALRADWTVFAACGLLVLGEVAFPLWYFQGLERLKEVAVLQVVAKVTLAVATIALVRSPQDAWLAAALSSAPQLAAAAAASWLGKGISPGTFYRPKLTEVSAALKQSWHMFASSVSTTLYLNTNTFVLGLMCGAGAVADYGLASKLVGVLQGIATPVTQAVFPRASLLFAERRVDAWALLARVAKVVVPAVALAALLLGVFAPQVVNILGGPSYAGAGSAVRIMLLNPVLIVALGIPAQIIMVNTGLTQQMFRTYLVVGLANLAVLPLLVAAYAANGAAVSLALAEGSVCILLAATLWRHRARLGMQAA